MAKMRFNQAGQSNLASNAKNMNDIFRKTFARYNQRHSGHTVTLTSDLISTSVPDKGISGQNAETYPQKLERDLRTGLALRSKEGKYTTQQSSKVINKEVNLELQTFTF